MDGSASSWLVLSRGDANLFLTVWRKLKLSMGLVQTIEPHVSQQSKILSQRKFQIPKGWMRLPLKLPGILLLSKGHWPIFIRRRRKSSTRESHSSGGRELIVHVSAPNKQGNTKHP